jgi:hypothetical protein
MHTFKNDPMTSPNAVTKTAAKGSGTSAFT